MPESFLVSTTNKSTTTSRYGGIASNDDYSVRRNQTYEQKIQFDISKIIPGFKRFKPVHPNAVNRKKSVVAAPPVVEKIFEVPPHEITKSQNIQQEVPLEDHKYKLVLKDGKYFLET